MGHQVRRHRPENQKPPIALAIGINGTSKPGENVRPGLRLVQNDQAAAGDNGVPLRVEPCPVARLLEIEVSVREEFCERRLTGLAGTQKGNRGKTIQACLNEPLSGSGFHALKIVNLLTFCKNPICMLVTV
jgi:hypothetical protein